jgi:hypothetical protein
MNIYGSEQENRDIEMLQQMRFEVVNPSDKVYADEYDQWLKDNPDKSPMGYWQDLAVTCQGIAFRACPDGAIPAGVAKEIAVMRERGCPVIELPSCVLRRTLKVDETKEFLRESGQR